MGLANGHISALWLTKLMLSHYLGKYFELFLAVPALKIMRGGGYFMSSMSSTMTMVAVSVL